MTTRSLTWLEDDEPRDLLRWALAAVIVLGLYGGALAFYLRSHQPDQIGDDSSPVTVELAPIDSTPDAAQPPDVAPAPETMVESKAVVAEPPQEKPPEPVKIEQPPEETPIVVPEPPKPQQKVEEAKPPAPATTQRAKAGAPRIEASWQSNLVRHLQRYKRYPSEALSRSEEGVVLLSFSLDRNGHVLAHSIARSSGYPELDQEVMAMIMRAEPLPAFPASMSESRLDLTVPIRFSLR